MAASGVVRWTFKDIHKSTVLTLPINPNEGGTPSISKQVATNMPMGPNRRAVFSEGRLSITDMSFGGVILTRAHLEALEIWALKRTLIEIDDDLGRRFQGVFVNFTPSRERRATNPWYHTFQATFAITLMINASGLVLYGGS